ncbi:MAG TPA: 50S ribosomal protein L23, partial [Acetobacteraceae bacterium]|nr:50S ribosomal protein L23 [Acetobacteraceae bacterium]
MSGTVKRKPALSREAMYQIIRNPVITEKATMLSEHG